MATSPRAWLQRLWPTKKAEKAESVEFTRWAAEPARTEASNVVMALPPAEDTPRRPPRAKPRKAAPRAKPRKAKPRKAAPRKRKG